MSQHVARYKVFIRLFIIVALTLIAILAWFSFMKTDRTPTAVENSRALIGGPFELVNHLGKPVTEKDFLGKYMLVYFGYTYCPDVCPMDLQIMADALRYLTPEQLDQINPVFVTVDPERDTVETMAEYVTFFHEKLIGLTGTVEQINKIKKAYRVYAAKADDSPDYLVDHTAYTYLMDKDGIFLQHFNHGEDAEEMAAKIASYMNK
ncbi:MAG: SCO family protein [Emcibacteraceae bacterium]